MKTIGVASAAARAARSASVTVSVAHKEASCVGLEPGGKCLLPLGSLFWYHKPMPRSILGTKKSRGRPKATGPGVQIGMRWQATMLDALDNWRRNQPDLPARPEAIRRLVERALKRKR